VALVDDVAGDFAGGGGGEGVLEFVEGD